jgi:hypothetical protein
MPILVSIFYVDFSSILIILPLNAIFDLNSVILLMSDNPNSKSNNIDYSNNELYNQRINLNQMPPEFRNSVNSLEAKRGTDLFGESVSKGDLLLAIIRNEEGTSLQAVRNGSNLTDRQIKNIICGSNSDYDEVNMKLAMEIYNEYKNTNLIPEERTKMNKFVQALAKDILDDRVSGYESDDKS